MPVLESVHNCTLYLEDSYPPIPPNATTYQRFRRKLTLFFVPSRANPRCSHFYRSRESINKERKRQLTEKCMAKVHPLSMFSMCWDMSMIIVLTLCLAVVPYESTFHFKEMVSFSSHRQYMMVIFDFIFLIDIICAFNTGYIEDQRIVLKYDAVIKHYLFGPYFIPDLLTSLPIELIMYGDMKYANPQVFHTLFLFKVYKFIPLIRCLVKNADYFQKHVRLYHICFYHVLALLFFHWCACMVYFIPQMEHYYFNPRWSTNSWVMQSGIWVYDRLSQYTICFFRVSIFLLCVGHGFYEIRTIADGALAVFCFITGYLLSAFFFIVIYQYFKSFRTSQVKYQLIISQVNQYMKHKKLPIELQTRLISYYDYKFKKRFFKDTGIKEAISERLKKEMTLYGCRKLVENVTLFRGLPETRIANIISLLVPQVYLPTDIIVKAGTTGDSIYFLSCGTVAVLTPNGKEVCHLQDGAYFGEIGLMMKNQKRVVTVVAIEICEVYRMDRKNFLACFSHDSAIYKEVESVAKQRFELAATLEELHTMSLRGGTQLDETMEEW